MNLTIDQQLEIARQLCPDLAPLLSRYAHELPGVEALCPTVGRAVTLMSAAKEHQAEATRRSRCALFATLFSRVPELEVMPMLSVTPATVARALDTCWPAAPTNWNKGRTALCALYNYAIRHQWVRMDNPAAALDVKPVAEQEILALPPARLRDLLRTACTPRFAHLRAYVAICAFAGVRPTEAARLTWADVDLQEGTLTVRAEASKTGGARHVEMHPTLRAWLMLCRPDSAGQNPGQLVTKSCHITAAMYKLRRAASRRGDVWQADVLRHSYATYYLKAGGDLATLQWNMGHSGTHLLRTRYVNMRGVTKKMAAAWWSITPDSLDRRAPSCRRLEGNLAAPKVRPQGEAP